LQRLFRQNPQENAVIEVNNLFASKALQEIHQAEIAEILMKYNFDFYSLFKKNIYEFYAASLKVYLSDEWLDEAEKRNLRHLAHLLSLQGQDVIFIHEKIAGEVYRHNFVRAISNGRLSELDQKKLDDLWRNLEISEKMARDTSKRLREDFVNRFLDTILAKQRMSPDDDKEFDAIGKSLKVKLSKNDLLVALDHCRLLWEAEKGPLTSIEIEINLQKGEECYYASTSEWHEDRTSRGQKYWKCIDRGDFFLTNKRVIFSGRVKNTSIKLDKILSFSLRPNGVQLHKDAGKSPLIIFEKDSDLFSLLLPRVMKNNGW
jgi:hypothetical protein